MTALRVADGLSVRGLAARYGTVRALRGVDLEVGAGEIVGVVGPNGAGKSTLLAAIAGLVPAASGEIWGGRRRIDGLSPERLAAQRVSLVPERGRPFPRLTVEENLRAVVVRGRREHLRRIGDVYEQFPDLHSRRSVRAGNLSGGERQQLAIARALVSQPWLLLLDEPSLGLSPRVVREVFALLPRLRSEGMTILVAEQRLHELLRIVDRVYALVGGHVEGELDPRSPAAEERLMTSYFGRRVAHDGEIAQ